jgi:hypothetical protein
VKIYIPTFGRSNCQVTYNTLVNAGLAPILVVDKRDPYPYKEFTHQRGNYRGLPDKRHAILSQEWKTQEKHVSFDDDLRFCTVTDAGIRTASNADIRAMIKYIAKLLDTYPQVGLHPRMFVNYQPRPCAVNSGGTPFRVIAHNPKLIPIKPRMTPEACWYIEDKWVWHEIAKQGLPYAIVTAWCSMQPTKRTHFTHDAKRDSMHHFVREAKIDPAFYRPKKDGSLTVSYSRLSKHYRGVT